MFYESVQFIKVNIGKNLAGQIADGNTAGVAISRITLAMDYFFYYSKRLAVSDLSLNQAEKNFPVDIIKKFLDIGSPNIIGRMLPLMATLFDGLAALTLFSSVTKIAEKGLTVMYSILPTPNSPSLTGALPSIGVAQTR